MVAFFCLAIWSRTWFFFSTTYGLYVGGSADLLFGSELPAGCGCAPTVTGPAVGLYVGLIEIDPLISAAQPRYFLVYILEDMTFNVVLI